MNNDNTSDKKIQEKNRWQKIEFRKKLGRKAASLAENHLSIAAYQNMKHCGDLLTMLEDEERKKRKLETGYFCKQRFCPSCAWRKSVKDALCIDCIVKEALERKYIPLFVTLTVPNVSAEQLKKSITELYKSYKLLMQLKDYKVVIGAIRKLEVTYNAKREFLKAKDCYHPHLHLIWMVPSGYFKGSSYISQKKLLEAWQKVTKMPNITQVNIKRMTANLDTNGVLEIAKYSAKASDYTESQAVFDTFWKSLKGARLLTFSGLCRELREEYKSGLLNQWLRPDTTEYVYRVLYEWENSVYVESEVQRLNTPVIYGEIEPDINDI